MDSRNALLGYLVLAAVVTMAAVAKLIFVFSLITLIFTAALVAVVVMGFVGIVDTARKAGDCSVANSKLEQAEAQLRAMRERVEILDSQQIEVQRRLHEAENKASAASRSLSIVAQTATSCASRVYRMNAEEVRSSDLKDLRFRLLDAVSVCLREGVKASEVTALVPASVVKDYVEVSLGNGNLDTAHREHNVLVKFAFRPPNS